MTKKLRLLATLLLVLTCKPAAADPGYDSNGMPDSTTTPPAAAAKDTSLPKGLAEPCLTSISEYKNSRKTAALTPRAQKCDDQLVKSWKNCSGDSDDPKDSANIFDLSKDNPGVGAVKLTSAYNAGRDRSLDWANRCKEEQKKMDSVCDANKKAASTDLSTSTNTMNAAFQAQSSTLGTDPAHAAAVQQYQQAQQDHLKITGEYKQVQDAQAMADKALADRATCDLNQARIYDEASKKSTAEVQTTSSQGPGADGGGGEDPNKVIADEASHGVTKGIVKQEIISAVSPATEAGGSAVKTAVDAGVEIASGTVPADAVQGAVQGEVLGTAVKTVGLGFPLSVVGFYFGSTVPAGTCSGIYDDPVEAYGAGCKTTTSRAMDTLAHN